MAIHDFGKIFMHIDVKKFSLASNHRSTFIVCNTKLGSSFIVFTLDEDVVGRGSKLVYLIF